MTACDTHETPILYGYHAGIVTAKFYETWDFYTELLGFRTIEEDDHHVLLRHPSGAGLKILRHETNEQHAELVSATDGRGFWLNLDIADVDAVHELMAASSTPGVEPLEVGPRGRFFTVRDPNGVLIRIARAQPDICNAN